MKKKDHYKYISRCFELAERGRGSVSPNPLVSAVLVKNGKIIGEGWHKKYGKAHAEVNAIKNSTEGVKGATLYCNLEPCSHTNKQTPPCVPLIIQKGIKRVVISNIDPNNNVNGRGIKLLRKAGIEVITGVEKEKGEALNKFYFKYITEKIPYVTLKIAQSIDGKISEAKDKQTWLTGKESNKFVHLQRASYDAVLVGANTVKVDNPQLNVRLVKSRNPIRIIIDGALSISVKAKILNSSDNEKTWIFTSTKADEKKVKQIENKGAKVFRIKSSRAKLRMSSVLKILGENRITSLWVEGGQNIFSQFLSQDLFDEIIVLQTPKLLGKGLKSFEVNALKKLKLMEADQLGENIKLVYVQD